MDKERVSVNELASKPSTIKFAFQPVFETKDYTIFGYEALMRPNPYSPLEFIEELSKQDRLQLVEEITNFYGIKGFMEAGLEGKLFLNSLPAACMSLEISDATERLGGDYMKNRLVYEIVEYTEMDRFAYGIKRASFETKGANPMVAIDDFGTGGNTDMGCIDFYKADIVKIDREIIAGIDSDAVKQKLFDDICSELKKRNVKVLAEGVETKEEFKYLKDKDIDFMQGFYLGKPKIYA